MASLLVCLVEFKSSLPVLPVAAISAAKEIVSLYACPYDFAMSAAVAETSFLTFNNSEAEVADRPP